jgi:hypothetical protein
MRSPRHAEGRPSLQTNIVDCDLEAEDRPEGKGGVQADRRRAAAFFTPA